MSRYNHWSEQEQDKIMRLHEEEKLTLNVLAIRFGASTTVISELIRKARKRRLEQNAPTSH